jgi:hypothetical protein
MEFALAHRRLRVQRLSQNAIGSNAIDSSTAWFTFHGNKLIVRIYTVPLAYTLTYDTRIIRDHIRRYHMHIRIPSSCEYEYYMRIIYEYAYNSDTGILYFRSQILLLYSRHKATRQTCKLRHVLSLTISTKSWNIFISEVTGFKSIKRIWRITDIASATLAL